MNKRTIRSAEHISLILFFLCFSSYALPTLLLVYHKLFLLVIHFTMPQLDRKFVQSKFDSLFAKRKKWAIDFHACLWDKNLRGFYLRDRTIREANYLPPYTTHRALQDGIHIRSFWWCSVFGGWDPMDSPLSDSLSQWLAWLMKMALFTEGVSAIDGYSLSLDVGTVWSWIDQQSSHSVNEW